MSELTNVAYGKQAESLKVFQDKKVRTLSGGLDVPSGTYKFTTADNNSLGILQVNDQWALPIIAGTMTVGNEKKIYVISADPSAKTLVIADQFFRTAKPNTNYDITIATNTKGSQVVKQMVLSGSIAKVVVKKR